MDSSVAQRRYHDRYGDEQSAEDVGTHGAISRSANLAHIGNRVDCAYDFALNDETCCFDASSSK